jgi:hypothetical protein
MPIKPMLETNLGTHWRTNVIKTTILTARKGSSQVERGLIEILICKATEDKLEVQRMIKLNSKDKKKLRSQLYERDGRRCHYCGIEGADFPKIWRDKFCGGIKLASQARILFNSSCLTGRLKTI